MDIETARKIESELNVQQIMEKLFELPKKIREAEAAVMESRDQLKRAKTALELENAHLLLEIQTAVNPATGKPLYSNAESRNAELIRRQATDEAYKAAADAVQKAESDLKAAELEVQMLRDEFQSYKALAEITAQRLKLYS